MTICMPPAVCGAGGVAADGSLYGIISSLGLTTNLKLCLDAGDANSYDPAVQTAKWLDTSGNGYDFYRGTSGAGDGAEPTFNGSAGGLSSAEYFSFDGGDYFLYDSATEAWMNNLHKDNAAFSFLFVVYLGGTAPSQRFFSTNTTSTNIGAIVGVTTASNTGRLDIGKGGSGALSIDTAGTIAAGAWKVFQVSLNEATGASGALFKFNSATAEAFTSTYTSPSASDSAGTASIGGAPDGTRLLTSGSRLACIAAWEGTALSATNLTDIYNAIKGRFGL